MATNVFLFLRLSWCMACAKTSLPVPVSPVSKTVVSVSATFLARSMACKIILDLPMIFSNECFSPSCFSNCTTHFDKSTFSIALLSKGIILLLSSPFVM